MAPSATSQSSSVAVAARSPFLYGPRRDALFLIFSPLLALLVGFFASRLPKSMTELRLWGQQASLLVVCSQGFTHAHLFAVLFRSHGNPSVFRQFPFRFTLVPAAVFGAMLLSPWILAFGITVATIWDVYHSSMQVFGIGRIYDVKAGADSRRFRTLDLWLSHTLYIGPILAGVMLLAHLDSFRKINSVGSHLFDFIPVYAERYQPVLALAVLGVGAIYVIFYAFAYLRLARQGEPISWPKVAMLVSTAVCSIYAWGFNAFGQAFVIMNFVHALQYFAIVWWAEGKRLRSWMPRSAAAPALALLVGLSLLYGVGVGWGFRWWTTGRGFDIALALVNTISLMHFWYDGFVWSVRRREVPV